MRDLRGEAQPHDLPHTRSAPHPSTHVEQRGVSYSEARCYLSQDGLVLSGPLNTQAEGDQ